MCVSLLLLDFELKLMKRTQPLSSSYFFSATPFFFNAAAHPLWETCFALATSCSIFHPPASSSSKYPSSLANSTSFSKSFSPNSAVRYLLSSPSLISGTWILTFLFRSPASLLRFYGAMSVIDFLGGRFREIFGMRILLCFRILKKCWRMKISLRKK